MDIAKELAIQLAYLSMNVLQTASDYTIEAAALAKKAIVDYQTRQVYAHEQAHSIAPVRVAPQTEAEPELREGWVDCTVRPRPKEGFLRVDLQAEPPAA
jgi:hypothetical protein